MLQIRKMVHDHPDDECKEVGMKTRYPGHCSGGTDVMVISLHFYDEQITIIYVYNLSAKKIFHLGLSRRKQTCGSFCDTSRVLHRGLLDWNCCSEQTDCDSDCPGMTSLNKSRIHKNLEVGCFHYTSENSSGISKFVPYLFQHLLCCHCCHRMITVTFAVHMVSDKRVANDVRIRSDKTQAVPYAGNIEAYWITRSFFVLLTAVYVIQQTFVRKNLFFKLILQRSTDDISSKRLNEGIHLLIGDAVNKIFMGSVSDTNTHDADLKHSGIFKWFAPSLFTKSSKITKSFKSLKNQYHLSRCGVIPTWLTAFTVMPVTRFLPDTSRNPEQDMAFVGYRLATLGALPAAFPVSRMKIADAGFYYQGNDDEVICYSCRGRHRGWASSDDPFAVHRQISPNCPHLTELSAPPSSYSAAGHDASDSGAFRGRMAGGSDPDNSEDGEPRYSNAQRNSLPRNEAVYSSNATSVPSQSAALGLGVQGQAAGAQTMFPTPKLDLGGAVYPMYQDMESRRRSFVNWNENRAPPLQEILLNGMFYAGYADCVRCFYCGVGLKSWEPTDSVWSEHIRWRPNCGYLQAIKGEDYIRRVLAQMNREAENGDDARENVSTVRNDNSTFVLPSRPTMATQPSAIATTTTTPVLAAPQPASSSTLASPSSAESAAASELPPQTATATAVLQGHNTNSERMEEDGETRQSSIRVVPSSDESEHERLDRLQRENRELAGRLQCRVCNRRPIDTIFLPCGHLLACEMCTATLRQCPQCREDIQATARVHMG